MTIRLFNDSQIWLDDDGDPLASGKLYFYEAGTTTLKDTYTSKSLGTAQTNPVILDADGRPANPIWLSGEYKYKSTNSVGVTIGIVIDNLNAETASDTVETGVLVTNGSFETDSDGDGQPDNWTLTPLVNATIATDTTDSAHGKNSLKFLSGGSGGGAAASELFDVLKGEVVTVEFTYKASSATVKTLVDVYTYDKADGLVSQLPAYVATTGNPTSYVTHSGAVTIDATAVRAKVVITGIDAAGTTITAGTTTHFDYIKVNRKLISDVEGDVVGNADTATEWETTRTITMTGDVTADAVNIDGSGNIDITNSSLATGSVDTDEIVTEAVRFDDEIALGSDSGSWSITLGSPTQVIPRGVYNVYNSTNQAVEVQLNINSGWRAVSALTATGDAWQLVSDGTNVRLENVSGTGTATVYYYEIFD